MLLRGNACLRRSKFSQLHRTKSVSHEFANLNHGDGEFDTFSYLKNYGILVYGYWESP